MASRKTRWRSTAHTASKHAIAPHQVISRGQPLDRIGSWHDGVTRRTNLPIYARHPHPARAGAGPDAIAYEDVTTGDDRGEAFVVDEGCPFAIDELKLPQGVTVTDGQMYAGVRVIDPYQPERS